MFLTCNVPYKIRIPKGLFDVKEPISIDVEPNKEFELPDHIGETYKRSYPHLFTILPMRSENSVAAESKDVPTSPVLSVPDQYKEYLDEEKYSTSDVYKLVRSKGLVISPKASRAKMIEKLIENDNK